MAELNQECIVYFPDTSGALLNLKTRFKASDILTMQWYNPADGTYTDAAEVPVSEAGLNAKPPVGCSDALLVLKPLLSH